MAQDPHCEETYMKSVVYGFLYIVKFSFKPGGGISHKMYVFLRIKFVLGAGWLLDEQKGQLTSSENSTASIVSIWFR